jgi:hypothetical protein
MKNIGAILLTFTVVGFAAGEWLFSQTCNSPNNITRGGRAENGNCVYMYPTSYNLIKCTETHAFSSICTDPECTNCNAPVKQILRTCDRDNSYRQCFPDEPPYAKIIGGSYTYLVSFPHEDCKKPILTTQVKPLRCEKTFKHSASASCDQNNINFYIFDTDDCTGPNRTQSFPRAVCSAYDTFDCIYVN